MCPSLSSTPIVRAAQPIDLPTLLEFEQGIVAAERPFDPTLSPPPINYYDLSSMLDDPQSYVAVLEVDGQIIGSGSLRPRKDKPYRTPRVHGFLGFMYVRPEYRGRGYNAHIINHLLNEARERGFEEIQLTVYAENEAAIRAYQKVGFKPHLLTMRKDRQD